MTAPHRPLDEAVERQRLARRLGTAVAGVDDPASPLVAVDRDAFDANAAELVRRAAGKPVRVASKSIRVPTLLARALGTPGFRGVLSYSLREALWLVDEGLCDDVVMGYPTVDGTALGLLLGSERGRAAITLMVDSVDHLDVVAAAGPVAGVRVAIDVDAGLRLGPAHVGPKRSPLTDVDPVVGLARDVVRRGFALVGVMTYEGQVAGVPDDVPGQRARSFVVRRLKGASVAQLADRRERVARALATIAELEFWNAGGSGSIESTVGDPVVSEVAAGSGLLVPGLFDHYRSFRPRPAAFFGVPVVRRPAADVVTVAGGGFVASGAAGRDRLPLPWAPFGLHLTALEGAGEVQTPLTGPGARALAIGDWVWFRHAKAGELAEHANTVHLVSGDAVIESVPTYRGLGKAW